MIRFYQCINILNGIMKKTLNKIIKTVQLLMEQTEKPQGIYFDSEGRIWFANKHWTVDEFVNRCEGIEK